MKQSLIDKLIPILIILTISLSFFIWIKGEINRTNIPNCTAMTHSTTYTPYGEMYVNLLVNILTLNSSKLNINLKGNAEINGISYNISRSLEADYHYSNSMYHIKEVKTIVNPSDDLKDKELNKKLPGTSKNFFVKIKKMNQVNYIFFENDSPLFICNSVKE